MAGSIRRISSNDEDYIYGWILNDDCSFRGATCLISEEDGKLKATVPFDGSSQEIMSWFLEPNDWSFSLERSGHPPKTVFIKNVKSSDCYTLINPRVVRRSTRNMPILEPHGAGVIVPRYIVRGGAGVDYSHINCMRSVYRELLEWTGLHSLKIERKLSDDQPSLLKSFSAGFGDNDSVFLFRDHFDTLFVPYGSYRHDVEPENRISLWQYVALETSCEDAASIDEHMEVHNAVRVLLSIIYWHGIAIDEMRVKRNDERESDIAGMSYPASYRDAITNAANAWADSDAKRTDFCFQYDAIGGEGISKWIALNNKYSEITSRLYYLAVNSKLAVESKVTEAAILFEKIADAALSHGSNLSDPIECKIYNVLGELRPYDNLFPPYDADRIARVFACAYNSLKHSKKERCGKPRDFWIDAIVLHDLSIICKPLFQIWLAKQLGCKPEGICQKPRNESSVRASLERLNSLDFSMDDGT